MRPGDGRRVTAYVDTGARSDAVLPIAVALMLAGAGGALASVRIMRRRRGGRLSA
jgi:hypothetical protein